MPNFQHVPGPVPGAGDAAVIKAGPCPYRARLLTSTIGAPKDTPAGLLPHT